MSDARESTEVRLLPGARRVLRAERKGAELASLQIWIDAGSRAETFRPGSGIAHFLEHMVFKGTGRRDADAINREAECLGGQLNAYTSYDRTVYHLDLPAENAVAGLDLLSDFVWHPLLGGDGFAPEREVILRELAMVRDDPESHLFDSILAAAFGEDPIRFPVIGLEDRFREINPGDLVRFHRRHYRSGNAFLLLAGPADARLDARAETVFPTPDDGERPPPPVPFERPRPVRLRLTGDWEGGRGLALFLVPGGTPREALSADWVMETLAGGESGRLNRLLRIERRLVHFCEGFVFPVGPVSLFGFGWLAEPGKLEETERTVLGALEEWSEKGLPGEALGRAKDRCRFERSLRNQTVEGWGSREAEDYFRFGAPGDRSAEDEWLAGFDAGDWTEFVGGCLRPDRAMTGWLAPKEER